MLNLTMSDTMVNPYLIQTDNALGKAYDVYRAVNRTFTKPKGEQAQKLRASQAANKKARAELHRTRDERAVSHANLQAARKSSKLERQTNALNKQRERDKKDTDSNNKQISDLKPTQIEEDEDSSDDKPS